MNKYQQQCNQKCSRVNERGSSAQGEMDQSVCTEPGFQYAAAAPDLGSAKELELKQKQRVCLS